MNENTWRIESRQRHVVGIGAHNYFALVDPLDRIMGELHGVDDETGMLVSDPRIGAVGNPEVDVKPKVVAKGPVAAAVLAYEPGERPPEPFVVEPGTDPAAAAMLARLAQIANLSDAEFAVATEGPNWRRLFAA